MNIEWEDAYDTFESLYRARDEMQSALISARRVLRKACADHWWAEKSYEAAESLLADEDERLQDVIDALDDLWTELKDG